MFCLCAAAQSTSGDLVGTIYDATGATIPDALVTATNDATGVAGSTVSTANGQYHIGNLLVGTYTLSVTAGGFSKAQLRNVSVELNKVGTQNVTLSLGQTTQSIEVSSAAATIDTTSAQLQTTFEAKQMTDLPTASTGSGVINLSLLNAGVVSANGVGFGTGPSVGGQRPSSNNFTIEGIDNNNKDVTGPLVQVPNDAVSEFTVLQNQFSPDFGHSSGGQFNQVVKSGTNDYHGSLYEYFQNRNLNAADNFSAVQGNPLHPRYDDNRFGGTFGGPIKRNQLFFFVNYEYQPLGETASTAYYAPTAAGYNALASIPGINQTNLSIFKEYLGTAPAASPAAQLPNGNPVLVGPGNLSLGTQSSSAIPVEVGQISSSLPNYTNYESGVASVDYNISDKDAVRGRFIMNRNGQIDTNGFPSSFFTITPFNSYVVTLSEYHNFNAALTNEFRLGFNRYFNNTPVPQKQFPGLDQFPSINIYELNVTLGPDVNAPQSAIQNTYQLTDNVSWTHGNHTFKAGFDGWKSISPQSFLQRSRGDYEWSYLSDYLFDNYPDGLAQRSVGTGFYSGDQVLLSGYGNDIWKIRPNLSVNLGLRYEYQTLPYTERLQKLNALASVPGLISFNEPKPQGDAFMPRVGIAYSPGTNGNTSIRAGFGINYDILFDNLGILSEPPEFNSTLDVTGQNAAGFLSHGGILPAANAKITDPAIARDRTAGFIPDQKRPKSIQWNFGFQHVFAQNYTLEARYVGTRGINLPVQEQLNRKSVVNAQNALPVYFSQPSQAVLNSLTNTLGGLQTAFDNGGDSLPVFANAGFNRTITAYMPIGNSVYHGLSTQLTRRFANGLQFIGAYTWSHNIDDSTATTASTVLTPRRAQDSQDLRVERSSSALDHRQRLTYEVLYDLPYFKSRNWFLKNLIGNWEVAPIYTYQTGTLVTAQSAVDSNLNGDSASDRTIINPQGNPSLGSGTKALKNSAGQTVAYVVKNPAAMYIAAPKGTLPNAGRNTMSLNPINDVDLTLAKRFSISERFNLEFSARAFNILNHPQYIGGYASDVQPVLNFGPSNPTGIIARNFMIPTSSVFGDPSQTFSSNPRNMVLAIKLIF